MGNEVEKYDPAKLMDAVRDRIRAEFVGMIPEQQWTRMVDSVVTAFFNKESNYSQRSDFHTVVWQELERETRKRMAEYFQTTDWQERWDQEGRPLASKNAEDLVIKLLPDIQKAIFSKQIQDILGMLVINLPPRQY